MFKIFVGASLLLLLFSCSTESGAVSSDDLEATYSSISTQIFDVRCSCHLTAGPTPVVLSSDQAYANIVSQSSTQNSGFLRVNPGNPDESYLYMKIIGDSRITGFRMPRNGPPYLGDDEIQAIRDWIQKGAPND